MTIRRARGVISAIAISAAIMAIPISSAHAATTNWNCDYGIPAYGTCVSGSFNSWQQVVAGIYSVSSGTYNGFCIKAETSAGNIKRGSNCFPANDSFDYITIAASPTSEGYYYYGGSGFSYSNAGSEGT